MGKKIFETAGKDYNISVRFKGKPDFKVVQELNDIMSYVIEVAGLDWFGSIIWHTDVRTKKTRQLVANDALIEPGVMTEINKLGGVIIFRLEKLNCESALVPFEATLTAESHLESVW